MNLIFFTHPTFIGSQSMPRFATMLAEGMKARGHAVEVLTPKPILFKFPLKPNLRKWLGYIDQYLLFPLLLRQQLQKYPDDTLFVFTDHALGPWVPLVADRPHVIHCHDFLAQLSANGAITENPTGWSGRKYQAFIRWGYSKGKNFISVSNKTKNDLYQHLVQAPLLSKVVYNGFNQEFISRDRDEACVYLEQKTKIKLSDGFLLHVGGNQWYKNRPGVIRIYNTWRLISHRQLPLLLIGKQPDAKLKRAYDQSSYKADIHFLTDLSDEYVQMAYSSATVFLFPSLAEGFGWPIAEAMVSGCPVVTTNEAPMTEVAGDAGYLIPRCPVKADEQIEWAQKAAGAVNQIVELAPAARSKVIEVGYANAKRFDAAEALDKMESIYQQILLKETKNEGAPRHR